jgi:hypothetical protein
MVTGERARRRIHPLLTRTLFRASVGNSRQMNLERVVQEDLSVVAETDSEASKVPGSIAYLMTMLLTELVNIAL